MPLHRPKYLVEYDPAQEPLEVVVSSGDMMRAELEANKLRLPENTPFHLTALWLWSALVRRGVEERRAGEFIADPPEWQPVKNQDTGEPVEAEVDPTAAHGGIGSAVQLTTVPQSSG